MLFMINSYGLQAGWLRRTFPAQPGQNQTCAHFQHLAALQKPISSLQWSYIQILWSWNKNTSLCSASARFHDMIPVMFLSFYNITNSAIKHRWCTVFFSFNLMQIATRNSSHNINFNINCSQLQCANVDRPSHICCAHEETHPQPTLRYSPFQKTMIFIISQTCFFFPLKVGSTIHTAVV